MFGSDHIKLRSVWECQGSPGSALNEINECWSKKMGSVCLVWDIYYLDEVGSGGTKMDHV